MSRRRGGEGWCLRGPEARLAMDWRWCRRQPTHSAVVGQRLLFGPGRERAKGPYRRPPHNRGVHGREHRRAAHPTAGLDTHRTVPARHRTHTHDHAGVGLGLAIVKTITHAHDGTLTLTLTLTPRSTGGIRITVELPAASPPADR